MATDELDLAGIISGNCITREGLPDTMVPPDRSTQHTEEESLPQPNINLFKPFVVISSSQEVQGSEEHDKQ